MADFSRPLSDPIEAARRRHGFNAPGDLEPLSRLLALAARSTGAAELSLEDEGGCWYAESCGTHAGPWMEHALSLEGADTRGRLRIPEGAGDADLAAEAGGLILDLLRLRRMAAERRRNPRGPEGASFVPGVTHELRNFLFSMSAGLDAFEAHFGGAAEAEHAASLRKNLGRLQGFMEELSEYGNPGELSFALHPVQPVLAEAMNLAAPLSAARKVHLATGLEGAAVLERMDRAALERALRRLMELAVLETPDGGSVRVDASVLDGPGRPWLELVLQGGARIERDLEVARLFEPFYYRDKDMPRLGPAIARRMIEAHGGQATAAWTRDGLMLRVLLPVWMEAP
jgi:signal transduction histidine kinase